MQNKVNAALADKLAVTIKDNRSQPDWQEALWDELLYVGELDTKQVDILFGMVTARWDRAARNAALPVLPMYPARVA